MKRKLAALLVMTMALGVTACGGSADNGAGATAETTAEAAQEEAAGEATSEEPQEEAEEVELGGEAEASADKNAGQDGASSIFVQEPEEKEETQEAEEPAEEPAKEETAEEPAKEEAAKEDDKKKSGPVTMGYSLEKVGDVPADAGYIRTYSDALINVMNDNSVHMLTPTGEDVLGKNLTDIEYLGNDLYVVRAVSDTINNAGLVTADGEVLIDFEAGLIGWPRSSYSSTDRFLTVIYTTGETENQDEAIMYATDSLFSLSPSDEDTLYTGYRRIFDLETGKFVENAENTIGDSYCVTPCGDSFFMEGDDGVNRLYSADGKVLFETSRYISYIGNGTFLSTENGNEVYDDTGKVLFKSETYLSMLEGPSNYYYYTAPDSDEIVLLDLTGKEAGRLAVNSLYTEVGENVFRVKDQRGAYQLMDLEGNVLFDAGAESISDSSDIPGCLYYSGSKGFSYYLPDGKTGSCENGYGYSMIGFNADQTAYYCYADQDYTINAGSHAGTGDLPGTVECGESYDKTGLIDCFTGEKLLEERYSSINKMGSYLAAEDGETGAWEIYKVTGPINY